MYYITHGGFLMYFIIFMSILGLTGIIERLIYFAKYEVGNKNMLSNKIKEHIKTRNIDGAIKFCKMNNSTDRTIKSMLMSIKNNPHISSTNLEEIGKEKGMMELQKITRNMWLISLAAHLTPLMGLLGTVIGMIRAFQGVAMYGTGNPTILASGISEALYTTAGGLFVAVPALFFYNYFNRRIDVIVSDMEICATELINTYDNV